MSIHQVRELYDFAGLKFDTSPAKLEELKKVLLLHIRSSSNGMLECESHTYTKNDLLFLLEQEYAANAFDAKKFVDENRELRQLIRPNNIKAYFYGNSNELTSHRHWQEIQNYISEHLSLTYSQSLQKDITDDYLMSVHNQLSYLFCFNLEVQDELKTSAKNSIKKLLKESGRSRKTKVIITSKAYYDILKCIADDDREFLLFQYNFCIDNMLNFTTSQGETFFKSQLSLNFSEYSKLQIQESLNTATGKNPTDEKKRRLKRKNRIVFIIVLIIIIAKIITST